MLTAHTPLSQWLWACPGFTWQCGPLCFINAQHALESRGFRSCFAATDAADADFVTRWAIYCIFKIKIDVTS